MAAWTLVSWLEYGSERVVGWALSGGTVMDARKQEKGDEQSLSWEY